MAFGIAPPALAAEEIGARACAALTARVDAVAGPGPVFLRSYDHADGEGPNAEPALNGAFTYDNALATIALIACDKPKQALRIGEALLLAAREDRAGPVMGRLRNAYRPGAQEQHPVPPMGWWNSADQRWREDAYQVGTATGNVAWAGLALVTLAETTKDERYAAGARKLADWIVANTMDKKGGFTGGVFGDVNASKKETWKSTEHAADLAALFARLKMQDAHRHARLFLTYVFDKRAGHFPTGLGTDGETINRATSGLDAQLWPLLLSDAAVEWQSALGYAERAHGVPNAKELVGFDFNDDRDGLWLEGTAQAALVYRYLGRTADANRMLGEVAKHVSPGGYVWATREPEITTGLAIGPDSITDDFRYYRLPHLGATAWAALAATGWNPFTGQRVR
ncbi:MAG: hypothetical protein K0Q70_29 [Rhodospirillales bacterium]|nr:hypothetical protein [Rhodospirillales bacterium]